MNNLSAWKISEDAFSNLITHEEQLRFLVRYAVLAPSSHNSQPWKFKIERDTILLFPELSRSLPISDPLERNLHIALGCAIESIYIAADYYGLKIDITLFPKGFTGAVAKIAFVSKSAQSSDKNHLIFSIQRRRSNRNPYEKHYPKEAILQRLKNLATPEVFVDLISNQKDRYAIADFLIRFREASFDDKKFRGEMADYKRSNFTSSYIGMPGYSMGFGNLFSIIAPFFIRHLNIIHRVKKQEMALLVDYTPVFGVIGSLGNEKKDWVVAGRLLERMLLESERQGLRSSMSALPLKIRELQEIMHVSYYPQIFFRLGYTDKIPLPSPRLPLESVCE